MKRLLCLIGNMNAGGAETFLMKLFRRLDKTKYQMDFCVNNEDKNFYEDEVLKMGGKIFRITSKSTDVKLFRKQLSALIQQEEYKYILRITSNAAGFMDLKIAKKAGAKVCSARSSNSKDVGGWKSNILNQVGRFLYEKYVDVKIAPSDLAAIHTFGEHAYKNGEVAILHNALDLDIFYFDIAGRKKIRSEFGIEEDCLIIGHIGRFMQQKNHLFLLSVFKEIQKKRPDAKLLLVGNGELKQQIQKQIREMGLNESVIFSSIRNDISHVLSAMDIFVFPSLYEGMPNTVIEAQATGLPCIIADTITREADITGLVQYLSLEDAPEVWADAALAAVWKERKDTRQDFIDNQYDIQSTVEQFVRLCFSE